jgi:hypothetical protein
MAKPYEKTLPLGYEWRSSQWFILVTIAIALFAGIYTQKIEHAQSHANIV